MAGIFDHFNILVECSLGDLDWWGNPGFPTAFHLFGRDVQFHGVCHSIDRNGVAVLYKRNRSTNLGFRDDVTYAKPMRSNRYLISLQIIVNGNGTNPPLNRPSVRHATS
jgi:hypothetical protein